MGFPSPPLENSDLSLCPSDNPATPPAASLNTKRGGKKNPTPSYQLLQAAVSLGKKCDPTSFSWLWYCFGFPGEKMHLFVWGFLSDNASIVVHLPVWWGCFFFFLSDTPAVRPVPLPKANLCPGHEESGQPRDAASRFSRQTELKQAAASVTGAKHLQLITAAPHGASCSSAVRRAPRLPKGGSA